MTAAPGKVLVGGGTGFVGSHLCRLLRYKGYEVTVISRMPGPKRVTWHDIQEVGIPEGTTSVVNLAGQNVLDPTRRWTPGFKQNVWNSRIQTTFALAEAISDAKIKPSVFVSMSGVGIYEPNNDYVYSEESKLEEFDFLSKLCQEWEDAAKLPAGVACRQVVIRSGVVLGRDGGMIKQLYLPFYLGLGGPIGDGKQYLPWIHIGDLTRLILFVIQTNRVHGVINGVAPQEITNKEFTQTFARALSRPAYLPVPKMVLNIIFDKERAKMMTEGQRVSAKRAQLLGFEYVFPNIKAACEEIVNSPQPNQMD